MESTSPQPSFCQMWPHFYKAGAVWAGGPSCAHLWPLPPGTFCAEGTLGRSSMGRCSLFGGDFVNTFDESMYSFAGDCSYLLAGDCQKRSFSLIGEFWALREKSRVGWPAELNPGVGAARNWWGYLFLPELEDPRGESGGEWPFHDTGLPLASPWVSPHGSTVGWRESSCFSSGCVHCSASRHHPGSSGASGEMVNQKVHCNTQSS